MMKQPIKFVDLPAQYENVMDSLVEGITEIIQNSSFVGGDILSEFEARLANYVGTSYAIGCSDGTAALKLALLGSGIQNDDEVIVPANSFIASANAVVHAGGRPFFVDCDPQTFLIDLNQVEDRIRQGKTRFVMPVHLYGNVCPMDELMDLCSRWGVDIIEDNAQALGASYKGRRTGSFGKAAGVSFYPAKNLGAFGQGGAILTNDEQLAKLARIFAEQGAGSGEMRYHHDVIGYNDRLHTIQAFVLNVMIEKLDDFNEKRLKVADWYAKRLPSDRLQKRTEESVPVYHLFEYRCDSSKHREIVSVELKKEEIGFGFHYPVPIHKQKAYPVFNQLSLPVSEELAETLISLPVHPFITQEEVERVCDVIMNA